MTLGIVDDLLCKTHSAAYLFKWISRQSPTTCDVDIGDGSGERERDKLKNSS